MEINLTPDIEQALLEQAKRRGTTPEQLALESLRREFVHPAQSGRSAEAPGSLADFLSDSIGVLHSQDYVSGGARMSESTSEDFAKALAEKRKQGRL
jgi:hypothetical protein